jgi:Tetrapyrrole (Corrin/Porphyrin) Methylases
LAAGRTEPAAPAEAGATSGSLLILGSGIQSIGFTMDAEAHIRSADKVFFCVADAVTVAWLRQLRPDAYDLYVLYDDANPRYYTYIQMTEAMLHYVRRGMNVVGIFYGHPGVFVLSTHRAVRIARREGYRAVMRAGISALDCLCADLSVDPSQPGLQTFEATDLLLRRRRLDPGLHVIIWQVGLIGEMGYRRKGYLNDNFPVFVDYLQSVYGPDHPVTHYVAARYPTMEPLIATHELDRLLDHKVRATLNGLSTLYVPPRDGAPADLETAIALGLAKPGNVVRPSAPLREIDQYGDREMRAIAGFRGFTVPPDYQYLEWTATCQFLIDLARDTGPQRLYASDPGQALAAYPGLTERERSLLATRNEGAIQVAAKGKAVTDSPIEGLVHEALGQLTLARSLATAVSRSRAERSDAPLRE